MDTVKIITYGTLMTGERNHHYCRNAISITPCTITGTLYDTGYGYPAFEPVGNGIVNAELIEIPVSDFPAIDRLEGYPILYDRIELAAETAAGSEVGWIYIMNELPKHATIITSGDWKCREKF